MNLPNVQMNGAPWVPGAALSTALVFMRTTTASLSVAISISAHP
jgi:hypothetical protein